MLSSCSSTPPYMKTVDYVDLDKFMTDWYVIAGRLTIFEKGAHNAVESYSYSKENKQVNISFTMNQDSFDGKKKSIPQKAWIVDKKTNAFWKIRPFWPLAFDYIVIDLAKDYSWTVVGVPSQKWVWIMAKDWKMDEEKLSHIIDRLSKKGYSTKDIIRVPQKW